MAMLLWIDEDNDVAIDLGDPFEVYKSFATMAKVSKGTDWPELFSVPGFAEQQVESQWLGKVRVQAKEFLQTYGVHLKTDVKWVLQQLIQMDKHK